MIESRPLKLLIVCTLLISSIGVSAVTVSARADVQISSVTVTPDDPAPGETVTVRTTIQNLQASNETVEVTDVYLRGAGTTNEHGRIEDVGSIAPGGSITVPMSVRFDETGRKHLTVHVVVRMDNGNHRSYEYPVYVEVEEPDEALLSFSATEEAAVGEETAVNVTVANGYNYTISGTQLELTGSGTVENAERVSAAINAGTDHTFQYDVTFDEGGTGTLTANLTYKTASGTTRSATKTFEIDVVDPVVRAGLSASSSPNQSDTTEVELTNFGNVGLSDIEVTATDDGEIVARRLMADISPESSRTVVLNTGSRVNDNLTFTANYEAGGEERETTLTTNVEEEVPGEVRLTGAEVTRTGTTVTIDGDAANIGSTDVQSVLVSVQGTDGVRPLAPSGEYFIGSIDASEFATFELTAEAGSGVTSIPVEVMYIVDNERVTTTQQLNIGSGNSSVASNSAQAGGGGSGPDNSDGSAGSGNQFGGLPLSTIGIVIVLLVVAVIGFGVYRWRNQ